MKKVNCDKTFFFFDCHISETLIMDMRSVQGEGEIQHNRKNALTRKKNRSFFQKRE